MTANVPPLLSFSASARWHSRHVMRLLRVCSVASQLDDMRADSPHPIILKPLESGFNSHLTKVHANCRTSAPAVHVRKTGVRSTGVLA